MHALLHVCMCNSPRPLSFGGGPGDDRSPSDDLVVSPKRHLNLIAGARARKEPCMAPPAYTASSMRRRPLDSPPGRRMRMRLYCHGRGSLKSDIMGMAAWQHVRERSAAAKSRCFDFHMMRKRSAYQGHTYTIGHFRVVKGSETNLPSQLAMMIYTVCPCDLDTQRTAHHHSPASKLRATHARSAFWLLKAPSCHARVYPSAPQLSVQFGSVCDDALNGIERAAQGGPASILSTSRASLPGPAH
ncbi:uncharacterized protein [Zea mays]|uniref:Uncharacterized protein n=1 Tax=Zea mays TaxID=4577 RepID=A0A804U690_MAIZE|nr:uncharacterized protein LOC103625938 [Zea mays]|eukprot:XP_008644564.1 uncharacterized protein LOC103625938 [Zea mays]